MYVILKIRVIRFYKTKEDSVMISNMNSIFSALYCVIFNS